MTVASSTIKKAARDSLKNNVINSFIVCVAVLLCYLINQNICSCLFVALGNTFANILLIILNLFLFFPMLLGGIRYFWRILCGVCDNPISVFYYFINLENYLKAISIILKLAVKTILFGILFSLPYIVVSLISNAEIYERFNIAIPLWTANLSNLAIFLRSIATVGTTFVMLKYYLAPMLIVADENMDAGEAMHMSVMISKRSMLDFIFLLFSMLGWILLSLLFIPLLYTLPLFITVYLTHCSFAVNDYNEFVKKANSQNFPTFAAGV